ncbi:MAG: alanine--tRNA ligase, partial [Lachnospiraceae bacterium]|nr:alanine--tRNA ligase [Lachnospiraceae bacterium]
RIEAITGKRVLAYYEAMENSFKEAAAAVKSTPQQLKTRLQCLNEELKKALSENEKLKAEISNKEAGSLLDGVKTYGGIKALITNVKGADMNALRSLADSLNDQLKNAVLILTADGGGKVSLMVTASEEAVKKGVNAGNLIREIAPIVGGGGGGRPNTAQAGGKNVAGIPEALQKAETLIEGLLQ